VHEVSLLDLLDIARLTDTLPQQRALIGIQPEKITWRMQPTLAVKQALPVAVDAALQLMAEWRSL
jgi:hydrogenase maturation protease